MVIPYALAPPLVSGEGEAGFGPRSPGTVASVAGLRTHGIVETLHADTRAFEHCRLALRWWQFSTMSQTRFPLTPGTKTASERIELASANMTDPGDDPGSTC